MWCLAESQVDHFLGSRAGPAEAGQGAGGRGQWQHAGGSWLWGQGVLDQGFMGLWVLDVGFGV